MNIYCDDGSTNVKLAWFEGDELQTRVSANSFRHGWKVAEFSAATFNYQVGTLKYTWTASAGMPSRQQTWNISTVISTCWPCIMRC